MKILGHPPRNEAFFLEKCMNDNSVCISEKVSGRVPFESSESYNETIPAVFPGFIPGDITMQWNPWRYRQGNF